MVQRGEVATLNLVLKADVQGSLEALTDALRKLDQEHDEVRLSFVHRARRRDHRVRHQPRRGRRTPPSSASTCAPTARPASSPSTRRSRSASTRSSTRCSTTSATRWSACSSPSSRRSSPATPRCARSSACPRVGKVAGCYVRNGIITRGSKVRFLREGTIIWKGAIASLRRFKDDVREVRDGFECGIGLENYQDLKPGDVIETYEEREIARV